MKPYLTEARCRLSGVGPLVIVFVCVNLFVTALPVQSASAPDAALDNSEHGQIDAYIQSRMRTANTPGLALGVVRDDDVIYLKGYGVAGPDGRVVTPQTPFIIGSLSKSFTALAVMQLVEAGKIDLDAPVTHYLPWFRTDDPAASAQITVRHLLYQTSGLPVYEGRRGFVDDEQGAAALETAVRQLASVTLSHPPGQTYEYANENYTVLGQIIRVVSAHSYEDAIREQIFAPLQMFHSAAALTDPAVSDVASGHRYWFGWPVAFDAPYPRGMTPAGYLISSAEDMAHYLIAQLNGGVYHDQRVLSAQGIATLHAPGARMDDSSSYAMGWAVHGQPGGLTIEHAGDVSNFHSDVLLLPDQKIGIVILMNVNGFSNAAAINISIEGVAAILQRQSLTAAVDPPIDWLTPGGLLLPPLLVVLWGVGSLVFVRRWQRRRGLLAGRWRVVWHSVWPFAVDLCLAGAGWVVIPAQSKTPLATIHLFAPDVFFIIELVTLLSLGVALARGVLVFRARLAIRAA